MVMNNLDGTTKTEMSFGTKNKNVHATIKFDADSFRVLNKDGSTASLHVAQGTDADSAVTMNYLENQLTRIESQQDKITSSDENNMVHYNDESGTLGVNNITADRIVGLRKNRVVITDENAQVTTSTVARAQLLKLPNVPDDTNAELEKKADVDHSHLIADVEGLQDALDSKALSKHTHTVDDISGLDTLSVRNAEHAEEADSAKTDANGTPIGKYVRNVTISDNKITVTKGNGNIVTTEYIHNLVPATDTEDGKAGLVPAPCRADAGKFLSATGTWEKPVISLADAGVTLTAEEINGIPEDIAAVDARVDEADQNLKTAKADLEGKIAAQGSELHTAMGDLSTKVDTAVEDLNTKLEGKANAEHTHGFDEVTGLKQMTDNLVSADQEIKASIEELETTVAGKAEAVHTHEIADVTGLQDALDEKALADHDHTIDQISDIANANVAKAEVAVKDSTGKNISNYVYRISADGTNLTVTKGNGSSVNVPISAEGTYSEFEGATDSENGTFGLVPAPKAGDQNKVLSGAGTWVDAPPADLEAAGITATAEELNYMTGVTSGVQAQLDAKAAAVHTHEASEITDFDAAVQSAVADDLAGKANTKHTHEMDDVTGLTDALGAKADAEHTHKSADITDLTDTLSSAVVGEAGKATSDKNGKDITTYVADVTSDNTKITVTKGDGSSSEIQFPQGTVYDAFTGASAEGAGEEGLVPAPAQGDQDKFLKADGTWAVPVDNDTTYDVATSETAGLVKASSEIQVDGEGVMTVSSIPQSKVTNLENTFATMSQASNKFEITDGLFEDTRVSYRDEEIRVMYSTLTPWAPQDEAEDPNTVTMALRAYAPADATGYRIALKDEITEGEVTAFGGPDSLGRNYVETRLPVATYNAGDSAWTYLGSSSTAGKYVGWYVTVEWYNAGNKIIGSETVRVNLATESTFNSNIPGYMGDYAKSSDVTTALDGKADTEHTHEAVDITDLQGLLDAKANVTHTHATSDVTGLDTALAGKAASVHIHAIADVTDLETTLAGKVDTEDLTEATVKAASQDTNGKLITEYVAGVTLQGNTLKIAKGDSSTSDVELPAGTVYKDFTGASAEGAGGTGLVPAPAQGDQDKFLKADGTWGTPVDTNTTYDVATSETAGLVKSSSEIAVDGEGVMTVAGIAQEKVTGLTAALSGKADAAHTHTLKDIPEITLDAEQINGLPAAIAAKADVDHTHDIADITDLNTAKVAEAAKVTNAMTVTFNGDNTPENVTTFDGSAAATLDITLAKVGAAAATHTHEMDSVNGLSDALSGKANIIHSHAISDVTDLQTTLDGKAASEHTHEIADVTGLQDALNIKLESDDLPGIATGDTTGIVKGSSEISVGEDGALTVASIAQDKVSGLTEVLASKVDSDSLADATVGNATKATQDKNGKDITQYVADVTQANSKITITKGDGSSSEIDLPEETVYSNFTGTTGTGDGKAGLVPAPVSADVDKFLKSDGTWATVTVVDTSVDIATSDKAGIVKPGAEFTVAPEDGAMSIAGIEQSKVTGLTDALGAKADVTHTHEIANVNGLQDALDAKLTASTLPIATTDNTGVVKASAEISVGVDGTMTVSSIAQSKVADLETTLAGKAATEHTHKAADITDLNSAVVAEAGKTTNALNVTFNGGTQAENNVTFDGSAAQTLDITLAKIGAAAAEHTHETADITGLDTALAGKANSVHTHEMASVTGLSDALDAKADSEHTHTVSQITDIASATVAAAGKATNDKNDKDITTYVADVTFSENKITVKKGDDSSSEIELPKGTVYSNFTGASSDAAGGAGLVPAPAQGDQDKFLKADGTWAVVKAGSDVAVATEETAGIVKASSEIAVAGDGVMSITAVSQDKVTGLTDALGGKAASVHTHAISDVTDLQTTLDNKLEASDLVVATDSTPGLVKASTEVTVAVDGALGIGTIEQTKVNGLTAALGAKADTEHTHTVSDITDLNLSAASVAEATKATTDKNEKDITTYVADVKKSENNKKIVITKGDSSSTEIELPEAATYSAFTGASAEGAGSDGLVPGPAIGDQDKFLKADGTWAVPVDTNTTYAPATTEVAGIVRASTEIMVDGEGIMTVGSLAQSKVEGLTDALSGKANATHSHTASDISDLSEATVKAATQDTSGNALTSYVKSLSVSGSKLTVTKGDESSDELDLPSGGTGVSDPFTGTDGSNPGKVGLVPAPAAADADKFLASDGTWKIVQGAGGEVSIKYTSQVPTTAAVGGIEEGYIPPSSGIDILDLIYNLLHPYVAPELTATMLPRNGGTVGIATTQNITGVRVSLNKTGGNKIMSYQVYDVNSDFDSHVPLGELYSEDYENGFTTGAKTVPLNSPYQMTQASNYKYLTVRVMDLNGKETIVKTASFNFVETYYWGTAPGETVIDETFVNGDSDKTTQASAKGTKVVSVNNPTTQFVYFCAPKSYGEITSVKDQNQFENISDFKKNKTEVTINGRDYYVYHNDPFLGEMTFTFSY
jgi:hypothetical protein